MNLPIVRAIACVCVFTAIGIEAAPLPSAAGGATSSVQQLTSESILSQNKLDDRAAQEWGLTSKEYERYQEVMQGPRGVYSPGLDPLTALGIEARSESERRRFAELQVQAERQRVDRELAYQRAYDEAYQRLFPGIKAIEISTPASGQAGSGSGPALEGNGRMALFVKDDCLPCIDQVKRLQASQTPFDLYFVGSQQDDERIRRWAILAGIDPSSVKSQLITLNHDQGRWVRLGLGGSLPAAVTQVNGSWRRQ